MNHQLRRLKMNIEKWAFTFGCGSPGRNNYVVIPGSFYEARMRLVEKIGSDWAFQYPWEEFVEQIEKYGLTEVKLGSLDPSIGKTSLPPLKKII
jgi:hypothetical protein